MTDTIKIKTFNEGQDVGITELIGQAEPALSRKER